MNQPALLSFSRLKIFSKITFPEESLLFFTLSTSLITTHSLLPTLHLKIPEHACTDQ